jgi:hypothetical protein
MLLSRKTLDVSRTFGRVDYEKTLRTRLELCKEHKLNKFIFKRGFALILWGEAFLKAWGCSKFLTIAFRVDGLC